MPVVQSGGWIRDPLDAFVLHRLEAEGLEPAPEAEARVLLRRIYLDLVGLPPTVEELDAFVSDPSPDAYARVVDALLASPRFAEHFAKDWLDAARYADTHGFSYDLSRSMWPWRDWVIDAIDRNMPFDQFTLEQVAGDLLPDATPDQQLATGFFRNHAISIEGGIIDEEYRTIYVADRVDTLGKVWLGLTIGCARCHDHKFDPLSQRDYYQLFDCFNRLPETGYGPSTEYAPTMKARSPLEVRRLATLDEALERLDADLERWAVREPDFEREALASLPVTFALASPIRAESLSGSPLRITSQGEVIPSGSIADRDHYRVTLRVDPADVALRIRVPTQPPGRSQAGRFALTEISIPGVRWLSAHASCGAGDTGVGQAIDGNRRTGWSCESAASSVEPAATFIAREPFGRSEIEVMLDQEQGGGALLAGVILERSSRPLAALTPELEAVLRRPRDERTEEEQAALTDFYLLTAAPPEARALALDRRERRAERGRLGGDPPNVLVMKDSVARSSSILVRGRYDAPSTPVSCNVPGVLPPLPSGQPLDRLALARWLIAPENPLVARVTVNRYWQHYFGVGLVATPDDFGVRGERPTHPELLDYLAVELVRSGWDVKAMQRRIVTSATYRQSSSFGKELGERDPTNALLARGPRQRLDAEVIRDSALSSSGVLVEERGGPGVFPYQPPGLWEEQNDRMGLSDPYPVRHGPELHRRSVYTFWKRSVTPPELGVFDAPSRELSVVRRLVSTSPLQALALMNGPTFVEAARVLATRELERATSARAALPALFRRVLARAPTAEEEAVLLSVLEDARAEFLEDRPAAVRLLDIGETPLSANTEIVELAALTEVARVVLNLSEAVTKE